MIEQFGKIIEFSVCEAQKRAEKEADRIFGFVPQKGVSVEARTKSNELVRDELSKTSDLALVYLALERNHHLSRVELTKRLRSDGNFGLLPLLVMLEYLGLRDSGKGRNTLFDLGFQKVPQSSVAANQGEVVASIVHFMPTPLGRKSLIIEDVLSYRPDAEQISLLVSRGIEKKPNANNSSLLVGALEIKLRRSKLMREEREGQP